MPTMYPYWDVSTVHITREDDIRLRDLARGDRSHPGKTPLGVATYGWGHFVIVPGEEELIDEDVAFGFSEDFVALLKKAARCEVPVLRIDRDGEEHDELPKHDW
jgi:hypothetical protein